MANYDIDLTYNSQFGSEGTGNGEFSFPGGICILNDEIYVSDRQNNRIQVFDLAGVYQRQFGSAELSFPEGITTDGTYIFVCDSANGRVVKYSFDGTLILTNQRGTDSYPTDIFYYDNRLYIVWKQDSEGLIEIRTSAGAGTFIKWVGNISESFLNYPEGVIIFAGYILIADSGNGLVRVYSTEGVYQYSISSSYFDYPIGLFTITDTSNGNVVGLGVLDQVKSTIEFFDDSLTYVESFGSEGTGNGEFTFPRRAIQNEDKVYVVDSANHRIQIFDLELTLSFSRFIEPILKLTKQLYPTGRAFTLNIRSYFHKLHEALADSEARALGAARGLLDHIIPDNNNFTLEDASRWESAFGLAQSSSLTLEQRKSLILDKMEFPGDWIYRQNKDYLEYRLRSVGFDVYTHYPIPDTFDPYFQFGDSNFDLIANSINLEDENDANDFFDTQVTPTLTEQEQRRFIVYISGDDSSVSTEAEIPLTRVREFRELVLRIIPAHCIALYHGSYV